MGGRGQGMVSDEKIMSSLIHAKGSMHLGSVPVFTLLWALLTEANQTGWSWTGLGQSSDPRPKTFQETARFPEAKSTLIIKEQKKVRRGRLQEAGILMTGSDGTSIDRKKSETLPWQGIKILTRLLIYCTSTGKRCCWFCKVVITITVLQMRKLRPGKFERSTEPQL